MSLGKKFADITTDIGRALDAAENEPPAKSRAAPMQMLSFLDERDRYESRIAELERQVKDAGAAQIAVESLEPNPWQPRFDFNKEKLQELADSIEASGQLQPIVARRHPSEEDRYQIVAGERRWRAHRMLGRATIEALVREVSDEEMATLALMENVARADLSDYEVSKSVRKTREEFPSQREMATRVGMSKSRLNRYLAFDRLPAFVLDDLEESPRLLSGAAASSVLATLGKYGKPAANALAEVWPRVVSGQLEQTKLAAVVEGVALRKETGAGSSDREIYKLFAGREQAGSITKDATNFIVKLRSSVITTAQEEEIRQFIRALFKDRPH